MPDPFQLPIELNTGRIVANIPLQSSWARSHIEYRGSLFKRLRVVWFRFDPAAEDFLLTQARSLRFEYLKVIS